MYQGFELEGNSLGPNYIYNVPLYTITNLINMNISWKFVSPFQTPTMAHYTDYQLGDIYPCVQDLHQLFIKAPTMEQQAVREKYKSQK